MFGVSGSSPPAPPLVLCSCAAPPGFTIIIRVFIISFISARSSSSFAIIAAVSHEFCGGMDPLREVWPPKGTESAFPFPKERPSACPCSSPEFVMLCAFCRWRCTFKYWPSLFCRISSLFFFLKRGSPGTLPPLFDATPSSMFTFWLTPDPLRDGAALRSPPLPTDPVAFDAAACSRAARCAQIAAFSAHVF